MICVECGKECMVELDDSRECPECGYVYCSAECARWKIFGDESVCSGCYDKLKQDERAKIERWDFVDNTIHEMLKQLNPSISHKLEWDIHPINEIREVIIKYFADELKICTEDEFYPYVEDDEPNAPIMNGWYIIVYPFEGNSNNYKYVVEEMQKEESYELFSENLVKKYGSYDIYGPFEQESLADSAALQIMEDY